MRVCVCVCLCVCVYFSHMFLQSIARHFNAFTKHCGAFDSPATCKEEDQCIYVSDDTCESVFMYVHVNTCIHTTHTTHTHTHMIQTHARILLCTAHPQHPVETIARCPTTEPQLSRNWAATELQLSNNRAATKQASRNTLKILQTLSWMTKIPDMN